MEIKLNDKIELTSLQLTLAFSDLVELVLQKISDDEDSECRDKVVRMFRDKQEQKNKEVANG